MQRGIFFKLATYNHFCVVVFVILYSVFVSLYRFRYNNRPGDLNIAAIIN